jgi:uncharacterized membrane protein (UPF0127 family)
MTAFRRIANGLREILSPPRPNAAEGPLRVVNLERGGELATQLEVAASGPVRRKGLLGRDGLKPGEGLWIVPCESVHTFFMRFPIDLVYLDREHRVKKVRNAVGAWRMSACFSAHSVLELPAGTIRDTRTQAGDTLEFTPAGQESSGSRSAAQA